MKAYGGHPKSLWWEGGREVTPYNGLYMEAPPKGVPFSGWRYIKG